MKHLHLYLTLFSLINISTLAMEPAKKEDDFDKAYRFVCSKDGMYQKYQHASWELLDAIICKDRTRMSKAIESLPKEGRSYLINAHADHHAISYNYQYQQKYPQLYAQKDTLPYHISPLAMAVRSSDQSLVELLHAHKVRMDFMSDRKCILEHAAEHAPALIPFLIACGANVHANNESALFAAARLNSVVGATHLLAAGANVNAERTNPDLAGLTPLHVAGNNGKYEVAQFFLENGAEVDAPDSKGSTPLHWCTLNGNSHIASLLLKHGADVTKRDFESTSVIEYIPYKFLGSNALELIKNGAPYPASVEHQKLINEHLISSLNFNSAAYKKFVPALVEGDTQTALAAINEASGNELNQVTYTMDKYTFLHWAVIRNNLPVVTELINRRASHNSTLRAAALALPLISRAIQHPVQINAQDRRGWTPLMWAARLGLKPIYDALKSAGADENLKDSKGNNAFMLAALGGHMGLALESKPQIQDK